MTAGVPQPNLMTRLSAAMRGEQAATVMEAYRRAGATVYDDLAQAEALRRELATAGTDLWSTTSGQASQLLCTWNSFVLQTLGDQLVEADYAADPRTVGYLPPVTAQQAAVFLGEVEQWSARARRALADPHCDVTAELAVPALLPGWVEVEPCPRPHLHAMRAAARALHGRAEAALADLTRGAPPPGRERDVQKLTGMFADASSSVAYADSLWSPEAPEVLHERVESSLKRAIEGFYLLGQLFAMPVLLDRPDVQVAAVTAVRLPLPGEAGFDPWCLTDPASRAAWQREPAARRAIDVLWSYDPDPGATLSMQAQIDAAVQAGLVTPGMTAGGQRIGNYYCCPWSAIYLVRRPVTLVGRRLRPGQEFALDVSAEEMGEGGDFTRDLVLGPFAPTSAVDYCDPTSGGHAD